MTKPNLINYSEWVAEVERLRNDTPAARGLTTQELAAHYGHGKQWVRERILAPLAQQGRLQSFNRRVMDVSGKPVFVPEYLPKRDARSDDGKKPKGKAR